MKHVHTISQGRTPQTASTGTLSIIATVLSALGGLLLGIIPLLNKTGN